MITIAVTSVFVDDQSKAHAFYTNVLGFATKNDIPVGEDRWLTVVSPAAADGVELLLEPSNNPIAKNHQQALHEAGIPAITFATDDIEAEHARLTKEGVEFTMPPTQTGPVVAAVFDDTCGNLISLVQGN